MKNVITNIPRGSTMGTGIESGFDLARKIAKEHEEKTGNKCTVRRVLDYVDQYNGRDREHWSFDVVEIIN